jgi:glycosyltransferase involved in cell wall biosynthesis
MKASIIFSTHNKNWCLPNTLAAIARQKTTFPLEVCIVDDFSKEDPEPIIKEFLPKAKYLRLNKHYNFIYAPNLCLDMISDDVDIILPMSSDIIMLRDDTVEQLCHRVGRKKVAFAELANLRVSENLHSNFDLYVQPLINDWENTVMTKSLYPLHVSRKIPTAWLFFLGAALKEDLYSIGYRENSCDAVLWQQMAKQNFDADILTSAPAVHQWHPRFDVSCGVEGTCPFYCSRTRANGRWTAPTPRIKPFNVIKPMFGKKFK